MGERGKSRADEGWKPDKNIGGGETPVKDILQHLSAESTTEHQKSLHPLTIVDLWFGAFSPDSNKIN